MKKYTLTALAIASATMIAACGGDSSSTPVAAPPPAPTTLDGVVATGAALAGATVVIKDADAATPDVTTTTSAAGAYSADIGSMKAPFVVSASGVLNGETVSMVAVIPSITSNGSNVSNVTPLTNAVAVLLAPGGDVATLSTPATLTASATTAKVSDASTLVVNTLKTDPVMAAALGANFNPLTTPFTANGTGIDSVLDQLDVVSGPGVGVSITNLATPISTSGVAPVPVVLTSAQTANPSVVQTISASSAAGSLPTSAEMLALAKKYEACLALPVAQRVTLDAAGKATAVSATCNYAPSDWKSGGRNWVDNIGQFNLTNDVFTGAKAGTPIVSAVFPANNFTDPKEFKHPYCNTATCVIMRIPFTSASGKPFSSDWVLSKVAGAWNLVGNQRPYNAFVEQRLNRKTAMNTVAAASRPTEYGLKDRIEAITRLGFDLTAGSTSNIAAVRWTGPGLPVAGVVQHRSQRCGTDERMTITNQEGSLTTSGITPSRQINNNNGGNDFYMSAANLDGTSLALPVPNAAWATATSTPGNQENRTSEFTGSIPAYSVYKAEIFYFANTGTVADEVIYVRTDTPYEPASAGATKAWPTLDSASATAYITPTGTGGGVISSLAQTIAWTNPSGGYVGSAYLFAQNTINLSNGTGDAAANYGLRTRLDFRPTVLGNASAPGYAFASVVSGTSMSVETSTVGVNPNPRCTSTDLTALTTTNSAYRELGLAFRGADRKLYNAISFWSN